MLRHRQARHMDNNRIVGRPAFNLENALDRPGIQRIGRQSIDCLCRQCDHLAGAEQFSGSLHGRSKQGRSMRGKNLNHVAYLAGAFQIFVAALVANFVEPSQSDKGFDKGCDKGLIAAVAQLFVSQGIDGVELRGFARRIKAEENAHRGAEQKCIHNPFGRDEGWPMHLGG